MTEPEEVSRSGRVRKKSSKLLSIEKESLNEYQIALQLSGRAKSKATAPSRKSVATPESAPSEPAPKSPKVVPKLRIKLGNVPSISARKEPVEDQEAGKKVVKQSPSTSTPRSKKAPKKANPKQNKSKPVASKPTAASKQTVASKPTAASKPTTATKPMPAPKTPPATKTVPATKTTPATKTVPATKLTPATKPVLISKVAAASKLLPTTEKGSKKKKAGTKIASADAVISSPPPTPASESEWKNKDVKPSISLQMLDSAHDDDDEDADSDNAPNDLEIDVSFTSTSGGSIDYDISGDMDIDPSSTDASDLPFSTGYSTPTEPGDSTTTGAGKRQRKPPVKLKEDYVDFDRPANKAAKFFMTKKEESRAATAIAKQKQASKNTNEKKRRTRMPTAYTMWCNSYRAKLQVQCPGMDFASMNKKLGEVWWSIPPKEKAQWQKKAKRLATHGISKSNLDSLKYLGSKSITAVSHKHPAPTKSDKPAKRHIQLPEARVCIKRPLIAVPQNYKITQTEPMDVAAYLDLTGESMASIGKALKFRDKVDPSLAMDYLLDAFLCGTSALMCLTQQVMELDGDTDPQTHRNRMDDVAYFIPDDPNVVK